MQKIIVSYLLLASFAVLAKEKSVDSSVELPEMLVTATRTEVAQNRLSAASTVYTRKDIEGLQVKTVPELLRGTTGLDMTQTGGLGKNTSVFLRGTNSDHLLVLIDGIKVGSATSGTSPFEYMPIDQVERVEIIRGPQSSLYGSEAIGGVIQIFTRKGGDTYKPSVTLDAGGGSYDTYRAAGSVSGQWENSWYSLGASSIGTEGFNARKPIPGPYGFDQPDRDGYQNTAMNARAGHRFDNNAEVEASFMRSEGTNNYDGNFGDHNTFINQVIGVSGKMELRNNWLSTLRLGQSRDESNNFKTNNSFYSQFDTTRWNVSWLNEINLFDNHKLLFGSDYRLDEIASSEKYALKSRYDVGAFAEYNGEILDNHFVNASLRYDHNEQFGNFVSGNIGWRYQWDHGISILANFGNAFKAPTFNQLYYPSFGNPNLQPEESASVETGITGEHDWGRWELRAYHTNLDHLIIAVTDPKTFQSTAENVNKAQIDGIEAEVATQFWGWHSKLSMNLMSPVGRETNKRLPRRSDKTLAFDLSRSFGDFDVGANIMAQNYRFDDAKNNTPVAGYVTLDFRAAYHINANWKLGAQLNNALDKTYQTVDTYNTAERNFFFSIHYNN
ncbi:MAG: TonB-dependent receptor [Methylococcales bacterium]